MKYLTIYIASILVGCATVPRIWINAYEGAELPDKRIAKLHVTSHNYGDELRIDGIDYPMRTNLNDFWKTVVTNKFKLTPGEHEIYYSLHWFKLGFVQGTFLVSMKAEEEYHLSHKLNMTWTRQNETVTVTLENKKTNEIVQEETFYQPSYYLPYGQ